MASGAHPARSSMSARTRGVGVAALQRDHPRARRGDRRRSRAASRPVILQISENAVKFHYGNVFPVARGRSAVAAAAAVPVALHLDHVEDGTSCTRPRRPGFSSVMFDASKLAVRRRTSRAPR